MLKNKGYIVATTDKFLYTVSKNQSILKEYFIFPMSSWDTINKLVTKEHLYQIAETHNIPYPKTHILKSIFELENLKDNIALPLILKPSVPLNFSQITGKKVLFINNTIEYDYYINKIKKSKIAIGHFIIQEYIPGDNTNLYTITSYANKKSEIVAYSIGYKIRQNHPLAGSIIVGKTKHSEEILNISRSFIKIVGFHGVSNIEYKWDNRDNLFKLMEINPRPGIWNYSATACGVNISYIAYNDISGEKLKNDNYSSNYEIVWINLLMDIYKVFWGYKKLGFVNNSLSFNRWLKSIEGKRTFAVFKLNDIKPFLYQIYLYLIMKNKEYN